MPTELDYHNVVSAIKGDPIIRSCVSCKHYKNNWLSDPTCVRLLELKYHPITGKKVLMGMTNRCADDRCISANGRVFDPCGSDGKHWEEKPPRKFFCKMVNTGK